MACHDMTALERLERWQVGKKMAAGKRWSALNILSAMILMIVIASWLCPIPTRRGQAWQCASVAMCIRGQAWHVYPWTYISRQTIVMAHPGQSRWLTSWWRLLDLKSICRDIIACYSSNWAGNFVCRQEKPNPSWNLEPWRTWRPNEAIKAIFMWFSNLFFAGPLWRYLLWVSQVPCEKSDNTQHAAA